MSLTVAKLIPWLPALAAILCGVCCMKKELRKAAAGICFSSIFLSFIISLFIGNSFNEADGAVVVHFFNWIHVGNFQVNFSYFIDPLTLVMLYVVTGIGSMVTLYAAGYMAGDRGYARFFMGVSLFIFAMTTLVMADNLVLMFLGWEGVGLCSYLLIGFYYQKPSAVAAAKKAFIVNRVGDLAFVLGIFLIYREFGTVSYAPLFEILHASGAQQATHSQAVQYIPFLLMIGAFGKSAQLPLYVWLPDAMEGPTPVSALIHAATMVTAGVYLIARMFPLFELSPYALPTVAIIGAATAFFAATIALCQYDIKRIFAYSTISQLGYMFLGLGAMSTYGAVFHLFTHAFFKALLFLTAGSVMHALSGQLDLRKMSGLRHKMPVTCYLMLIGCLALSGLPPFAGFYSKDTILADVMSKGLTSHSTLYVVLSLSGLLTAFITAFYTFRLWFRVFLGPEKFEMGDDHHAPESDDHSVHNEQLHHQTPHEMPWLMNGPLVVLALGAIFAGYFGEHWIKQQVSHSTAAVVHEGVQAAHAPHFLIGDVHSDMMLFSITIAVFGILLAARYHLFNRPSADAFRKKYNDICTLLENKYYVDEIYDTIFVRPLRTLGHVFFVVDRMIIDGVVSLIGFVPRLLGMAAQTTQRGAMQGYGLGMAFGVAVLLLMIVLAS